MSHYLKENRIQDIIGVLQIMGSSRKYKMSVNDWVEKIENQPLSADTWDIVFKEHPEFFRENNKGLFSLMWRKGLPHMNNRSTRQTLSADQISSLMDTAIRFYSFAVEERRNKNSSEDEERKWSSEFKLSKRRWKHQIWLSVFTAFLAFAGATLAAWIKFSAG